MTALQVLLAVAGMAVRAAAEGTPTSTSSVQTKSQTETPQTSTPGSSNASNNNSSNGDGGKSNSPLLFFVALGFGVVFTNLW